MIKLYGTARSRAARSLWALEEVGQKYEHVPISPHPIGKSDTRKPEFLKINPNGHIPVLDDNGFIVWEAMFATPLSRENLCNWRLLGGSSSPLQTRL